MRPAGRRHVAARAQSSQSKIAVGDIDGRVARMQAQGAASIGRMEYGTSYRRAYIRGPEGIIVALAWQGTPAP